jgi:hypothetical protein
MGASGSNTQHQDEVAPSDRTSSSIWGIFGGSARHESHADEHPHRHHGAPLRGHDHLHRDTKHNKRHIVDKGAKFLQEEADGLGFRHAIDDLWQEDPRETQGSSLSVFIRRAVTCLVSACVFFITGPFSCMHALVVYCFVLGRLASSARCCTACNASKA